MNLVIRIGRTALREREPPVAIGGCVSECDKTVVPIGNRFAGMDIRVGDVVVGRLQVVVLQILTFQPERINHLAYAQVDGQVRTTIDCLGACRAVAVNDAVRIGGTREGCGDVGSEGFRFSKEVHCSLFGLDILNLLCQDVFYAVIRYSITVLASLNGSNYTKCESQNQYDWLRS